MPVFMIEGQGIYASGFCLRIAAESTTEARTIAQRVIREGAQHPPRMDSQPELQEVNIQVVQLWREENK